MLCCTCDCAGLHDLNVLSHMFDLRALTLARIDQQVLIDRSNKPGVTFNLSLLEMKAVTGLANGLC